MNDVNKVYGPATMPDAPMPSQPNPVSTQQATQTMVGGVSTPATQPDQVNPTRRIAVELIGSVLNTKSRKIIREFAFTPTGAMQIGDFVPGQSGDVRISSEGIVARDQSGNTTITIDGDTGDVTIAGQLQSGSVVTGKLAVGNDSIQIDGENKRMIFYDDSGTPIILIGNPS